MYKHYLIRFRLFWTNQVVLSAWIERAEQQTIDIITNWNLSYTDYIKIKGFPLFKLGAYKGGIIVEQKTVRGIQSVRLLNVL
jgi:hypothetical protein